MPIIKIGELLALGIAIVLSANVFLLYCHITQQKIKDIQYQYAAVIAVSRL